MAIFFRTADIDCEAFLEFAKSFCQFVKRGKNLFNVFKICKTCENFVKCFRILWNVYRTCKTLSSGLFLMCIDPFVSFFLAYLLYAWFVYPIASSKNGEERNICRCCWTISFAGPLPGIEFTARRSTELWRVHMHLTLRPSGCVQLPLFLQFSIFILSEEWKATCSLQAHNECSIVNQTLTMKHKSLGLCRLNGFKDRQSEKNSHAIDKVVNFIIFFWANNHRWPRRQIE